MPFNSYSTSASTRQNFFPLSHPPSAPLPHSYLSFLVGVRQINVNAGFTYHTVASTTLQATEWEQTAIQSTLGASKVVLQMHDTCKHCMATYWLAPLMCGMVMVVGFTDRFRAASKCQLDYLGYFEVPSFRPQSLQLPMTNKHIRAIYN